MNVALCRCRTIAELVKADAIALVRQTGDYHRQCGNLAIAAELDALADSLIWRLLIDPAASC